MAEARKRLLVVAVPPTVFRRFPPLLWRSVFDVSTPNNPRVAMKAISKTQFHLIIANYPLPGIELQRLLDEVRGYGSPCRASPLIVVTEPGLLKKASGFVGKGVNRVVSTVDPDHVLADTVSQLMAVAPRASVRLPIDLRTVLNQSDRLLMAQTVNISKSGMLITDPGSLRAGMRLTFSLDLPDGSTAVTGKAEVVRVTRRKTSAGPAVAFRFVSFEDQGDEVVAALIDDFLKAPKTE